MIWRRLVFVLVVLGLQGMLGALLPVSVSPPDLFLLTAWALTSRVSLPWAIGVGYGVGLVQDILGAGMLGFHAAGVMMGVVVANFVRRGLSSESNLNQALALLVAIIAKWLVLIVLGYWVRLSAMNLETLVYRFVPELLTTLLVGPIFQRGFHWAFGQLPSNDSKLL